MMSTTRGIDPLPPWNERAERTVIGSILIDAGVLPEVASIITPDDFYQMHHGEIFRTMLDMWRAGLAIDYQTVSERISDEIATTSQLLGYINQTASSLAVATHAELVRELSERRRAIDIASRIAVAAHQEDLSFQDKLAELRVELATLGGSASAARPLSDFSPGTADYILACQAGDTRHRVLSGIAKLDMHVTMTHGQLILIGARPSMGKSSLASQIAYNVATRHGQPVLIVHLESTIEQLQARMISQQTGVPYSMITGKASLSGERSDKVWAMQAHFDNIPLHVMAPGRTSLADIYTEARRLRDAIGLRLVIVDTINKLSDAHARRGLYEGMTLVSNGLAALAQELKVAVIGLTQLNRAPESRHLCIPQLGDLRDTGAAEQDADIVAFIYRADYYVAKGILPKYPEQCPKGKALIIVAKHRDGVPDRAISLRWNAECIRFESDD